MTTIEHTDFQADQMAHDNHICLVSLGQDSHNSQPGVDSQEENAVVGQDSAAPATKSPESMSDAPVLLDPLLTFASITLDDLESQRIAMENRYRSLTQSGVSENGNEWGFGLDERNPQVATMGALVDQAREMEKQAVKNLEKLMRQHPLGPWVKAQRGLGDKTTARLLGIIGDPYWHTAENRPRTVSELWAYCGLRPGQKRRKGVQANWSDEAKKRAWLLATSCVKSGGPYREVYDKRREHTEERLHDTECVRCGPAGKPAQPGSPWSKGHQHADALRITSKEILKDLWKQARNRHNK